MSYWYAHMCPTTIRLLTCSSRCAKEALARWRVSRARRRSTNAGRPAATPCQLSRVVNASSTWGHRARAIERVKTRGQENNRIQQQQQEQQQRQQQQHISSRKQQRSNSVPPKHASCNSTLPSCFARPPTKKRRKSPKSPRRATSRGRPAPPWPAVPSAAARLTGRAQAGTRASRGRLRGRPVGAPNDT